MPFNTDSLHVSFTYFPLPLFLSYVFSNSQKRQLQLEHSLTYSINTQSMHITEYIYISSIDSSEKTQQVKCVDS